MHGGKYISCNYYINNYIIKIQLTSYLCLVIIHYISYQPTQINLLVIHHAASISCLSELAKSTSYQVIANSQLQLQLCFISENCNHGLGKIPLFSWHGSVSLSCLAMVASQLAFVAFLLQLCLLIRTPVYIAMQLATTAYACV